MIKQFSEIGKIIKIISFLRISRRTFLGYCIKLGFAVILFNRVKLLVFAQKNERLKPRVRKTINTNYDLVVCKGSDPRKITRQAIEMLGGMKNFVKRGDIVVIKPNMSWDRTPQQAANTNPDVVYELVLMCKECGAKQIKVFDNSCNDPRRSYQNSGIYDAVIKAGGSIIYMDSFKYIKADFGESKLMNNWPIYRDAVNCDCFINVPVAKHHGFTKLTLSMKNLMGICGGIRGIMHTNIDKKLCELTEFIKPDLIVVDAYRILLRNGPTGGSLNDVEEVNKVIASTDPVLADAYSSTLFGLQPFDISYIKLAAQLGLGNADLKKANIKVLT